MRNGTYRTKSWEFRTHDGRRRRGRLTSGIPVYATRVLCEVANERGIATSDVLAGTGIAPADLDNPEALVAASDEIVAVRRLLRLLPDTAGLGIDVGSQVPADSPGTFRVRGDVVRDPAGALRRLDALLLADDAQHRRQAVRGRRHVPARTQCRPSARGCARSSSSNATSPSIVITVSEFRASRRSPRYADQVIAEVMLDKGVLDPASRGAAHREHRVRPCAQPAALSAGDIRRAAAAGRQPHPADVHRPVRRADAAQ